MSLFTLALATGALAAGRAADQQVFTIDAASSSVMIHVGKSGAFSFAGHTHEVAAPAIVGRVTYDAAEPSRSSVALALDAAQLRVTGKGEPAGDVAEVQRTMLSGRVLDVGRFRRIVFESRQVTLAGSPQGDLALRITGDLTLHGTTRPLTVLARTTIRTGEIVATGKATVKQTDFGIEPVSAGAGTVRVKDELDISFTVRARR